MKKIYTLFLSLLPAILLQAARPLLVGHRGSLWGLENSVESFTNGAKMGYEYLETDFKVTKDGKFVCTHDDDTKRLGGTKGITTSTLDELQSETLSQTRSGVKYTGRLCSAQEYLDVCKEYGCRPLIELKWATGINNNDCSNIPNLIKFIEDNGFRNKCIILTSMKPCLEYIRKNYPDIELQFLTGQYWESHFDWCVELGIDVDIQAGFFDKTTVARYHDEGLKVNMWTANTNDNYKMYGNMGCDFITTDNLNTQALPELDPLDFLPNTVDFPNVSGNVKGMYNPESVYTGAVPQETGAIRKAIAKDGQWNLLCENGIFKVSALTGKLTATYPMTGLSAPVTDIALSADGNLLALCGDNNVYAWASATSSPTLLLASGKNVSRIGVSGKMKDLKIYLLDENGKISGTRITKNVPATPVEWNLTFPKNSEITITPYSRDNLLIAGMHVRLNWETGAAESLSGADYANSAAYSFHRRAAKLYAMVPKYTSGDTEMTATLHDVTAGLSETKLVSPAVGHISCDASCYFATGISRVDDKVYLHLLSQTGGMATYLLDTELPPVVVEDLDLELETLWVQSNVNGNHPGNIDGTNAQQGTGIGGLFYVNNCVDEKIYVFDKDGLKGSIPGGKGWGCARDDAGNIVVRDDKLTGTEHSFIIYPKGATPENPGTPVRITTSVCFSGQTNFINAGGDLLGGMGHIYLYPNGQNAANIITVEKGIVSDSNKATDLTIKGSTAGYIIPLNDDPENFIYQVRATGMYLYKGGVNEALLTSRATTTPPARNSTGGGAYFTLGGNNILVFNSGANYVGGFTIKNLTTDKVVQTITPIGNMGYVTGGNYSTFNWLIPEKISDYEYLIHLYCPANGIALYRLYDKNHSGVEDVISDGAAKTVLAINGDMLEASGEAAAIEIYTITGIRVLSAHGNSADISALASGLYIARSGSATLKFVR